MLVYASRKQVSNKTLFAHASRCTLRSKGKFLCHALRVLAHYHPDLLLQTGFCLHIPISTHCAEPPVAHVHRQAGMTKSYRPHSPKEQARGSCAAPSKSLKVLPRLPTTSRMLHPCSAPSMYCPCLTPPISCQTPLNRNLTHIEEAILTPPGHPPIITLPIPCTRTPHSPTTSRTCPGIVAAKHNISFVEAKVPLEPEPLCIARALLETLRPGNDLHCKGLVLTDSKTPQYRPPAPPTLAPFNPDTTEANKSTFWSKSNPRISWTHPPLATHSQIRCGPLTFPIAVRTP
eukprot:1158006-Pelagomonas_calceolata.AAC.29